MIRALFSMVDSPCADPFTSTCLAIGTWSTHWLDAATAVFVVDLDTHLAGLCRQGNVRTLKDG